MDKVDNKMKDFVKNHIAFSELKKVGFFPKEMKFNDYEGITNRVLNFFGYKSIEDYISNTPVFSSESEGKFPDKIDSDGNYKTGSGFHLTLSEYTYKIICPICDCEQDMRIPSRTNCMVKKCKGCKRKISVEIKRGCVTIREI